MWAVLNEWRILSREEMRVPDWLLWDFYLAVSLFSSHKSVWRWKMFALKTRKNLTHQKHSWLAVCKSWSYTLSYSRHTQLKQSRETRGKALRALLQKWYSLQTWLLKLPAITWSPFYLMSTVMTCCNSKTSFAHHCHSPVRACQFPKTLLVPMNFLEEQ